MADIKTTLHREDAPQDNVYPNIVADNIPANSIDHTKVDGTIPSLSSAPTSADSGKVVTVDENGSYELKAVTGAVTSVNGQTGVVTISKYDLGLAAVALSGSYDDLIDKPPAAAVTSVNGQTGTVTISKYDLGLADVALTGSYNDLKDKPPAAGVTSVNGQTGVVTISKHDLGLGLVDNEPQLVSDSMIRWGFNFNNITKLSSGLYTAMGSDILPLSNAPDGDTKGRWAVLILKAGGEEYDYAVELAFSFTSNKVYTRRYYTSWSAWAAIS